MQQQNTRLLGQVLKDVSAELDQLRGRTARFEETVSVAIAQSTDMPDGLIRELQTLDRMHQELCDLAVLTDMLADNAAPAALSGDQIDTISKAVKLSTTKALLQSDPAPSAVPEKQSSSSELHLF